MKPFTSKPLTQSRCLSTAHEVTLHFNHSRSHAACQPPMKSRCISTTHAVTLPFNHSRSHAACLSTAHAVTMPVNRSRSHTAFQPLMQSRKALVSSEGEKQTPDTPCGQTRDRSGELIRNGNVALSSSSSSSSSLSSSSYTIVCAISPNWST